MTTKPLGILDATIPGRPIAWARTATTKGGKRLTPARYRGWKGSAADTLAAFARWRHFNPEAEVAIAITIHPDGVHVSAVALDLDDQRRPSGVSGDIDNYAKAVLDALQAAGVLANDAAVSSLEVGFDPHPLERSTP